MASSVETTLARYVLGEVPDDALPNLAIEWLSAGYDGESLVRLSGASADADERQRELFEAAIGELGYELPNHETAGRRLATGLATRIIRGEVQPQPGAEQLWRLQARLDSDIGLKPLLGIFYEYDDIGINDDRRRAVDERIRLACREYLASSDQP